MKPVIFIFVLSLAISPIINIEAEDMLRNDAYLQQLKTQLPAGWLMKIDYELLQIVARQDCYILFENKINAPLSRETELQRRERFEKYGEKTHASFTYRLLKKRSKELFLNDITYNHELLEQIRKLEEQASGTGVKKTFKGDFLPATDEETESARSFSKRKS